MIEFIQSISESEIEYISSLDYGQDSEKHQIALKDVIFKQSCETLQEQYWFPMEVIELGSSALIKGHEKEYAICTLLYLMNNPGGTNIKFESQCTYYDSLPTKYRDMIIEAYELYDC